MQAQVLSNVILFLVIIVLTRFFWVQTYFRRLKLSHTVKKGPTFYLLFIPGMYVFC